MKKHDLLEEMLSQLVHHLRWQRIYSEYSEQLTDIKEANLNGTAMETEPIVNGHWRLLSWDEPVDRESRGR